MAATPQNFTLVADTEKVFTLDRNCGMVRVVVYDSPAVIRFNTRNTAVPAMASAAGPNQIIPAVVCVVEVEDETSGADTIVRMRSAGTPTVMVTGW